MRSTVRMMLGSLLVLAGCGDGGAGTGVGQAGLSSGPEVSGAAASGVSAAVSSMPTGSGSGSQVRHEHPLRGLPEVASTGAPDPVVQTSAATKIATLNGINVAGVGDGDYGFVPNSAPPDTNGAVGATQYVQWVNESFAVFDKTTGALIKGPTAGNLLFQALGSNHPCAVNNDGDPIAQYDKIAGRWVLTQFSVTNGATVGYFQCVAVSQTSDATGAYNVYAFQQPNFNDYPKLGVWPDAYYVTFNMFAGNTFQGARVCALDRAAMLAGRAATQVCFQEPTSVGSLLPSDLDGANLPPAGSPDYLLDFATNSLDLYKFHVDFATPGNSTFSGPQVIPVAAFSTACSGGSCIPQPGTSNRLDSLGDRLMYRLAYRVLVDGSEHLVVNHSVAAGGTRKSPVVGVRWYELTVSGGAGSLRQQGTYSPDSDSRWMGSIAMDKLGNIALGYSVSSSSVFPGLRVTGRLTTDSLGTLEAESLAFSGSGSQTGSLHRWGDYSALTVDPVDNCTFYYTNEYLKASGSFNWSTRIYSFKFPGCL